MTEVQQTLFDVAVSRRLSLGWQVVSDGPTGISLIAPKKNRDQIKLAYALGLFLLPMRGLGLLFLLAAFLDDKLTKPETVFIRRE